MNRSLPSETGGKCNLAREQHVQRPGVGTVVQVVKNWKEARVTFFDQD